MSATNDADHHFWWSGDAIERFWIEQLQTDEYGDRLIAPDNTTYRPMHGVEIGDVVFHWFSERHPQAGPKKGGIYAVSRVTGPLQRADRLWEEQTSIEIPLSRRSNLNRPILLEDLKQREHELRENKDSLTSHVQGKPLYSPWQFPKTGLKPMTRYLTKLTATDLEVIAADHPHIVIALGRV
ncbi:hypothetical protein M3C58_01285 [Brachybacterium muris]|uniref:hypothetical protein n=1 Tax=Brachybacterium muris TaxID=219301 RepID=UPI0021A7EDF5|nr:hypothetical protein [Brachybacterium muris]MCT1996848.1 hypothetical protein [Brachybacterium muris]